MNFKVNKSEQSLLILRYYSSICLDPSTKTTKRWSQGVRSPRRDL